MALKWYHTIEILCSADMRVIMRLTEKDTNIDADTVDWMYYLALAYKYNSYDNPTWDEAMNGIHK